MKAKHLVFLFILCLFAPVAKAKTGDKMKGGLGISFPDFNSFSNPANVAKREGAAIEAAYEYQSTGGNPDAGASFVYGKKGFGFGAFVNRTASTANLTKFENNRQIVDVVGAQLGFHLAKDKLSFGLGYQATISSKPTNDGTAQAMFQYTSGKGMGFTMTGGASTVVNGTNTVAPVVGMGYIWKSGFNIEALVTYNDVLRNSSNYSYGGYMGFSGRILYLSAGATQFALNSTNQIQARLGVNLGSRIDLSASYWTRTLTNSQAGYGATLRLNF